jgi:cephalosporin-C deacetylase-like acetyl esterase
MKLAKDGQDGYLGTAKAGSLEWKEAMNELETYFKSLSPAEKKDLETLGYNLNNFRKDLQ